MREIKFRSWSKDKGLLYAKLSKGDYVGDLIEVFRNGELNQFTGLQDKNGKEIYEGDIIQHDNDALASIIYIAEGNFSGVYIKTPYGWVQHRLDVDEFEVIGNIYENPELLEGNKE